MEIVPSINSPQNAPQSKADGAASALAQDFDTFLALLTTQLQYQDPLEPLDSKDFTQQLVSFSGVEQQIAANKNLEKLIEQMAAQDVSSSVAYIGKEIVAHSNKALLQDGEAKWGYYLDVQADTVDIIIRDSVGATVLKTTGNKEAGDHDFVWDGVDEFGNQLPDGYYTMEVVAKTASGTTIKTETYVRGLVDGVERVGGDNLLSVNGLLMPIDNIQAIVMPQEASEGG
ncbi:MAG: flagellar hook assembly protein FlgD [Alphaproteobacteria bacterium]|nr:MAG: flagellar hook assembly protein FlgD [Alphaproteobacteria bacterium]